MQVDCQGAGTHSRKARPAPELPHSSPKKARMGHPVGVWATGQEGIEKMFMGSLPSVPLPFPPVAMLEN